MLVEVAEREAVVDLVVDQDLESLIAVLDRERVHVAEAPVAGFDLDDDTRDRMPIDLVVPAAGGKYQERAADNTHYG